MAGPGVVRIASRGPANPPGVGPVESIRTDVTEVLRTQRFDTRAEAEAVARSVRAGWTCRVDLTPSSAIAIPDDGSPVFRAG